MESRTRNKATLQDRYAIYIQACHEMGITPKSFDEWLGT
jgi:hypothetical protein